MENPILLRKRLIPNEIITLKDDIILSCSNSIIVTKWNSLHPKADLDHGYSCYYMNDGFKISEFYKQDNTLLCYYCDIVEYTYSRHTNELLVTDLLADIIIHPDGTVKIVDLNELVEAVDKNLITIDQLKNALMCLHKLSTKIYEHQLPLLTEPIDDAIENLK